MEITKYVDEDGTSWGSRGSLSRQEQKVMVGSGMRKVTWSCLIKDLISQVKRCVVITHINKDLTEFFSQNSDKIKSVSETQV